jgi:hypothetical protein
MNGLHCHDAHVNIKLCLTALGVKGQHVMTAYYCRKHLTILFNLLVLNDCRAAHALA